jgi:flagellar capping protein FliD
LTSALQNNPDAVAAVLGGTRTATLNPDSRGAGHAGSWISRIDGTPTGLNSGTYTLSIDPSGAVVSVYKQTGEKAQPPVTATLTAGDSTSMLVPGLKITAGALPSTGVLTDTLTVGGSGVLGQLNDFMTGLLGGTGPFKTQSDLASRAVADLNKQIDQKNAQLSRQQQTLQSQFTAMEAALARVQGQGTSLMSSLVSRTPTGSGS